jgi:predicted O-methyltransferase YrrM
MENLDAKELIDSYLLENNVLQVYEEYLNFAYWVKGFKPENVLEIGSHQGATFLLLTKYSTGKRVSVDIVSDVNKFISRFQEKDSQWIFIQGDSKSEETFTKVQSFCDKFDLIFIDGDHSYEGVKSDFEIYVSLLTERGCIIFHDIDSEHVYDDQVAKFWKDLPGNKTEIICKKSCGKIKSGEHSEHFGGIGIWQR